MSNIRPSVKKTELLQLSACEYLFHDEAETMIVCGGVSSYTLTNKRGLSLEYDTLFEAMRDGYFITGMHVQAIAAQVWA